jgi:hypothetical protein
VQRILLHALTSSPDKQCKRLMTVDIASLACVAVQATSAAAPHLHKLLSLLQQHPPGAASSTA